MMAFDSSVKKMLWSAWLGTSHKGVCYHFSLPHFDQLYVIWKLSISEDNICSFSRIGQKIKNYCSLKFLSENLKIFRSTEHLSCTSGGIDNFSYRSSTCRTSLQSGRLAELKYAIFSRTGRKTKNIRRSNLFPSTIFKNGLLEGSTVLFQYNSTSCTPLKSYRLGKLKYAISAG